MNDWDLGSWLGNVLQKSRVFFNPGTGVTLLLMVYPLKVAVSRKRLKFCLGRWTVPWKLPAAAGSTRASQEACNADVDEACGPVMGIMTGISIVETKIERTIVLEP